MHFSYKKGKKKCRNMNNIEQDDEKYGEVWKSLCKNLINFIDK